MARSMTTTIKDCLSRARGALVTAEVMFENMVDPETKAELRREIHSFRATIAALEEAQELTGPAQMYAVQIAMAALEASPWMEARQRPTDAVKAP